MSKLKIHCDPLEEKIREVLAPYPDPMSRKDFRTACRIGTRTSIYLLKSGLVPCVHTGKKTRCYKISKADVAEYLRRREMEPGYYTPPSGWYQDYPNHKPPASSVQTRIKYEIISKLLIRQYFEEQLASYPDVMSAAQISQATGYNAKTVAGWCRNGMRTPPQQCSLTADDGASSPLEWCMATAGVVHRAAMLRTTRGCPCVCAWIHPQSGWYRRCR